MGGINNLQSGNSFKVIKNVARPSAEKGLTLGGTNSQVAKNKAAEREIAKVKNTFDSRYAENEKVEILMESAEGVAVIQSRTDKGLDLQEMAQAGGALASYALELKAFDADGNGFVNEDELFESWGEQLGESAMTIGGAAVAGAGTGATIGGIGGTVVLPGIGTVAGAGGVGAVVGVAAGAGATIWEGVQLIGKAFSDTNYEGPSWAR